VCALLAMMWKPIFDADNTDMHAYAFAAPCVATRQLSEQLRPFVTSGGQGAVALTALAVWSPTVFCRFGCIGLGKRFTVPAMLCSCST
jgi:hypothetical protein